VTPALDEPLAIRDPISGAILRPAWSATRLLDALERGPLVLDAAMGTRLLARGLDLRRDDPCLWNLDRPQDVLDVHRLDVRAGARVLLTNTFGANAAWLGRRGDLELINVSGASLAWGGAAAPSGFVLGDIGPSVAGLAGAAGEQAGILAGCGVDGLVLETFELPAALAALGEIRRTIGSAAVPVLVSLWRWPEPVEDAARRLVDAGAAVVGLNCRPHVGEVLGLVRRLRRAVPCPILVKPGVAADDPASGSTPAAFAAAVPALLEHGVRLLGGCCGTTEEHVAAIAAAVAAHPIRDTHRRRGAAT
jgi:methionine synthase I (cobalamin-dependent)